MGNIILALLLQYEYKGAVPAQVLTAAIIAESKAAHVSPLVVTRLIILESHGMPKVINELTHDYGLMQINIKTATNLNISEVCLLQWRCNLRQGVRILSQLQHSKYYRHCAYNLGIKGALKPSNVNTCLKYEQKLLSFN